MEHALADDPYRLEASWAALTRQKPLRNRDAARSLGVSEAHLVASLCGGRVTRLDGPFGALLERMPEVGRVMTLTRNEACVHEKTGRFEDVSHSGAIGLVLGDDIDLRVFLDRWRHGFLVEDAGPGPSFQLFDAQGEAVHKIYLRDDASLAEWTRIARDHRADDQTPGIRVEPPPAARQELPDREIDAAGFRRAWATLRDTHDFFGLLRTHRLTRTQALRLADPQFARPIRTDAVTQVLHASAARKLAIMVFVGNTGCIQIHTGPVERVQRAGTWINVMDPGFNLHLREDLVASAWLVRKPTTDGVVTSIEVFDARGELIVQMFGARKPGVPELEAWRALVADLDTAAAPVAAP
jgi:putative hemin transport protein